MIESQFCGMPTVGGKGSPPWLPKTVERVYAEASVRAAELDVAYLDALRRGVEKPSLWFVVEGGASQYRAIHREAGLGHPVRVPGFRVLLFETASLERYYGQRPDAKMELIAKVLAPPEGYYVLGWVSERGAPLSWVWWPEP